MVDSNFAGDDVSAGNDLDGMGESRSPGSDFKIQQLNRNLSAVVACGLLGFGVVMAYQNREAVQASMRDATCRRCCGCKKSSKKFELPKAEPFQFKPAFDWKEMTDRMASQQQRQYQFQPSQIWKDGDPSQPNRQH